MANIQKKYQKIGIIAGAVALVALAGVFVSGGGDKSLEQAVADVSEKAVSLSDVKVAVLKMDQVVMKAKALESLRKQKEEAENGIKKELERAQKKFTAEKDEIEKNQKIWAREALQKRVTEYQTKVQALQKYVTDRAQAIEVAYNETLLDLQKKHVDGVLEAIAKKKGLAIILDGRSATLFNAPDGLDITDEVIKALDKKVSKFPMKKPQEVKY